MNEIEKIELVKILPTSITFLKETRNGTDDSLDIRLFC